MRDTSRVSLRIAVHSCNTATGIGRDRVESRLPDFGKLSKTSRDNSGARSMMSRLTTAAQRSVAQARLERDPFAQILRKDPVYERLSPAFYVWLVRLIDGRLPGPAND